MALLLGGQVTARAVVLILNHLPEESRRHRRLCINCEMVL